MKQGRSPHFSQWNFYSVFLILCFAVLILFKWPLLPTFIDIYYHLSTVLGLDDAGGFVTTA
ncbi:hypothetical protein ACFL38_05260, partial [Candidatus Omnitrophota bacterium]